MVTNAYKAYLKSEAWQRKRTQVFAFYGRRCFACKTARGPIQVHHLSYQNLGNEKISELRPLCRKCHGQITKLHWKLGRKKSGFWVFALFMELKKNDKL